jgi:hypothetical protein
VSWTEAQIQEVSALELGSDVSYVRLRWSLVDRRPRHVKTDHLQVLTESAERGRNLAVLVPTNTETRWFQDYCLPWEVWFIRRRVTEVNPTKGSALVIMGPVARRGRVRWWNPSPQLHLFGDAS